MAEEVKLNDWSISNINIPPYIRELIGGKGFDWIPQFGQANIGKDNDTQIVFRLPYKEPPIVICSVLQTTDPKISPLSYKFEPLEIVLPEITLGSISAVEMEIPATTAVAIKIPEFILGDFPKLELPDLKFIKKAITIEITKTLSKVGKLVKSTFTFPLPPKIGAWNVVWYQMTSPGIYGTKMIETTGNVIKDPAELPDDGLSSITQGVSELPTIDGLFEIEEIGDDTTEELTAAEIQAALDLQITESAETFEEPTGETVVTTPSGGGGSGIYFLGGKEPILSNIPLSENNNQQLARSDISVMSLQKIKVKHLSAKPRRGLYNGRNLGISLATEPDTLPANFDTLNVERKDGQFTGMFDFDFGEHGVFAGASNKIGFKAQAEFDVEKVTKLFMMAGGAEGYRVWIGSSLVIDKWTQKSIPDQEIVSFSLDTGVYVITYEWWNWDSKIPAVFIATIPPLVPKEIGKIQFDLENALELANLNAWNYIRDSINKVYDDLLPVWSIGIPQVTFPEMILMNAINFTVKINKIKVARKTVFKGKSWTLRIPKLRIRQFKLLAGSTLTLDLAAPFIAANNGIFNLMSIFPRWFGRFQGREIGKHVSAGLNALGGVLQSAFDFAVSAAEATNSYIDTTIDATQQMVEDGLKNLSDFVNVALEESLNSVKDGAENALNDVYGEMVEQTNALSTVIGQEYEKGLNEFKTKLVSSLETNINELVGNISDGVNENVNEALVNVKSSLELSVNETLNQMLQAINEKIDVQNENQRTLIESELNRISKITTDRLNYVLSIIVTEISRAMGIPEGTAIVQATPFDVDVSGFKLPKNAHGLVVNWFAIGTPQAEGIATKAINVIDF